MSYCQKISSIFLPCEKYWKNGFLVVFICELCYNFYGIVTRRKKVTVHWNEVRVNSNDRRI